MPRFVIYVFPALIDLALGCVMFVAPVRMARVEGSTASAVTMLATIWAGVYMVMCRVVGLFNTDRTAPWLTAAGALGMAATGGLFLAVPSPQAMYGLMVPQAVSTALFFVPFQVFMKAAEGGKAQGIVRSTALYTASWSIGLGSGPFVAGWMMTIWGWRSCMWLNVGIGVTAAVSLLLLRHHAKPRPLDTPAETLPGADRYAGMPDLAWLGWVGSGAGFVAVALIRALVPKQGEVLAIAEGNRGMILAVLAYAHSLTAMLMLRSRSWMYRPSPVTAFGLVGVAGLVLFALAGSQAEFLIAAACFGVYSGAFCFYFVFHSLVHPNHSGKYVSINESVVGTCSIIGPLVGGGLADGFGYATPYLTAAMLVCGAIVLQAIVHNRFPATQPPSSPSPPGGHVW